MGGIISWVAANEIMTIELVRSVRDGMEDYTIPMSVGGGDTLSTKVIG